MSSLTETIVAQATPPGRGGVGIVRVSGPQAKSIASEIIKTSLQERRAQYQTFYDHDGSVIDLGIILFFPNPNSFTGEDVVEFQGHGGPIVIDNLLKRIVNLGARLARPGEFCERAFLNDKMDLTQAEAIADLIDSNSQQAARSAIRSLQGDFSKEINRLLEQLIQLRMYVEAALDFPEEEIDFLSDGKVQKDINNLLAQLETIQESARQGALIREGFTVVIAGKPNAGKSTLLNALSGTDCAIVTDVPGTTRDVMREHIQIDGLPIHIIDTAGLRDSDDRVEQEGIRRAKKEIEKADHVLLLLEAQASETNSFSELLQDFPELSPPQQAITIVNNKIDLLGHKAKCDQQQNNTVISLSAKTGEGLDLLKQHLKECAGYHQNPEGTFIARRRHLEALEKTNHFIHSGLQQLTHQKAGELLADDLRQAQNALSEITGIFTPDDLLGKIFSSFCIGK